MANRKSIVEEFSAVDWDFPGFRPGCGESGIHDLHWYPAPFPPGLAGTMLDILGCKDATFLDPFCGVGIAPLEAWFRGARAFGCDNNRFVLEICRAKIDLIQKGTLDVGRSLAQDYLAFRKGEIAKWRRSGPENLCTKAGFDQDAIKWFARASSTNLQWPKSG